MKRKKNQKVQLTVVQLNQRKFKGFAMSDKIKNFTILENREEVQAVCHLFEGKRVTGSRKLMLI